MKWIVLDGKRYEWKEVLRIRREQREAARKMTQPPLFEMLEDARPKTQKTPKGRYEEPLLFD